MSTIPMFRQATLDQSFQLCPTLFLFADLQYSEEDCDSEQPKKNVTNIYP
jgi:hypothetical protein